MQPLSLVLGCRPTCAPLLLGAGILLVKVSHVGSSRSAYLNEAKFIQPCADEAKTAQPCAHDHGCTPRRHRISALVGAFCPGGRATPGASGSREGPPILSHHSTWINPQVGCVDYSMVLAWAGPSHAPARAASRPPGSMFRGLGREVRRERGRARPRVRWRSPWRPRWSSASWAA